MAGSMSKRVIVFGGGVAGLSAAHELCERGFDVEVYERRNVPGGKARSVSGPTLGGTLPLPGEHGFRFFPGFYRHLPDTMRRIPYCNNPGGVYDNLVDVDVSLITRGAHSPLPLLNHVPRSWSELELWIRELRYPSDLGLVGYDFRFFLAKIWRLMTSCQERRLAEYEKVAWWDFIDAEHRSPGYQQFLAKGLTTSLVAAQAHRASARTIGDIFIQLNLDVQVPGKTSDRVLAGPTNDVWIGPWLDYLTRRGVAYHPATRLDQIELTGGMVSGAWVAQADGTRTRVQGDYYVCALPVEQMANQIIAQPELVQVDPALANIVELRRAVAWMNGGQFYLDRDVMLGVGHALLLTSPWSLTSISQAQFWRKFPIAQYANGEIRGILSVDISDWQSTGLPVPGTDQPFPPANQCKPPQIADQVWAQLKAGLNGDGVARLPEHYVAWHLDQDIEYHPGVLPGDTNAEPLLVNDAGTWALRPQAHTAIANLFLASDYIQTYTDLATMESANEAARRAVNAILTASGVDAPPCQLWNLHEPDILAPLRALDRIELAAQRAWSDPGPR